MNNIDERLSTTHKGLVKYNNLQLQIDALSSEILLLEEKVSLAEEEKDKEQRDVDSLSGNSISNIFYSLIGKLDDKLEKEEAEAVAAQLKLNQYWIELKEARNELEELKEEQKSYANAQAEFDSLYEEKKKTLINSDEEFNVFLKLYRELEESRANQVEIDEAIRAGELAMSAIESGISSIGSASGWGLWDMIGGGGIITTAIKHSHIDDASAAARQVQAQLRRFKTELADIKISSNIYIEIGNFAKFADYFFDGLFADWFVQSKINNTKSAFYDVKRQVSDVLNQLDELKKIEIENEASLEKQIDDEILKGV